MAAPTTRVPEGRQRVAGGHKPLVTRAPVSASRGLAPPSYAPPPLRGSYGHLLGAGLGQIHWRVCFWTATPHSRARLANKPSAFRLPPSPLLMLRTHTCGDLRKSDAGDDKRPCAAGSTATATTAAGSSSISATGTASPRWSSTRPTRRRRSSRPPRRLRSGVRDPGHGQRRRRGPEGHGEPEARFGRHRAAA